VKQLEKWKVGKVVPRANGQSSPIDSLSTVAKTPATGEPNESTTTAMEMVELNSEKNSYNDRQMML